MGEYQNNYPKLPNHSKINENLGKTQKNTKNEKKHIKSKEKRPKAIDSSHNACRYGYPFFPSPSDDDAMLEIPNPTPSVHQTVCTLFVFVSCAAPKRKETRLSKIPQQNKTQRQVKSQHCTFSPKSPKFQEYQNNYPKLPNHSKINENL